MSNILTFQVDENHSGKKIREYLKSEIQLSTRLIRGASKEGRIKVNGKIIKMDYVIKAGDKIKIQIDKEETQNIEPEEIDLQVVYEDNDVLVVDKPPFMVVHPTRSHQNGTLANGALNYFMKKGENCIVRLVSRLDMNTSGLIIIAKNQFSHMFLAKEMEKDSFKKGYLAIVHGNMNCEKGTIDLPIYRPEIDSIKRTVDEKGQKSITHYEVVQRFKNADLVKLELETGRTHQIRVHLSHLGNPIYGDTLYGTNDEEFISRQALHASNLVFPKPRDNELLYLESDLPQDMKDLIIKLINDK
jgi:pseudouridine synthase, RluA family